MFKKIYRQADLIRKLWAIIPLHSKNILKKYSYLWTLTSLIEVMSIVSILPLLYVLSDIESFVSISGVKIAHEFISQFNKHPETVIICVVLFSYLSIIVFLAVLKTMTLKTIHEFLEYLRQELSTELFRAYIEQPYDYISRKNKSVIVKEILSEVDQLVTNGLKPIVTAVINIFTATLVAVFLFAYNAKIAILCVGVFLFYFFILKLFVQSKIDTAGIMRREANEERFKVVNNAFNGIVSVKTVGLEGKCAQSFQTASISLRSSLSRYFLLSQGPNLWLEALLALVIILSIFAALIFNVSDKGVILSKEFVEILVVFALAAYRVKPGVQNIAAGFASLLFVKNVIGNHLNVMDELFQNDKNDRELNIIDDVVASVSINNLCIKLQQETPILDVESLYFNKSCINFISGESGSGKSTLTKFLVGLIAAENVNIIFNNQHNLDDTNSRLKLVGSGYLADTSYFFEGTIRDNICVKNSDFASDERIWEALELAQISEYVSKLPNGLETELKEWAYGLSNGQRQRLAIARLIYLRPAMIVLDEATNALDFNNESIILKNLLKIFYDRVIIFVSHREKSLESHPEYIVKKGKVHFVES